MKQLALPLLTIIILSSCQEQVTNPSPEPFDETVEKAAILKTIEHETDCFYRRDYDCWKENFVQADYAFQAWSNSDGTFDAKTGWKEVDKGIGDYIRDNPVDPGQSSHPIVEKRNMVIKFFNNNVAYLVWDQYNSDKEGKSFIHSKDQRIMEKIGKDWKIANVSSFWDYKNIVPADSLKKI